MKDAIRRHAPDERASTELDPTIPPASLPLLNPTRITSAPPPPPHEDSVTQLSLPVNPHLKKYACELSSPHTTTLGKNVMQYSPSVTKPLQRSQRTRHTTTGPKRQPQKACNHKRKRSNPTYSPTPDRETTRNNTPPGTQKTHIHL